VRTQLESSSGYQAFAPVAAVRDVAHQPEWQQDPDLLRSRALGVSRERCRRGRLGDLPAEMGPGVVVGRLSGGRMVVAVGLAVFMQERLIRIVRGVAARRIVRRSAEP